MMWLRDILSKLFGGYQLDELGRYTKNYKYEFVFSITKEKNITLAFKDPVSIFSNPNASMHSTFPFSMSCLAKYRAVEPVEQLLFTL